jgi:hypothetical protein
MVERGELQARIQPAHIARSRQAPSCNRPGFSAILSKPCEGELLIAAIRTAMDEA